MVTRVQRRERRRAAAAARTPFGIYIGAGAAVLVVASFLAAGFPTDAVPARLVVIAITVGGYAAIVPDTLASLAVAGLGFLLFTGFLDNRYGELTWQGATTIWHLVALALATGLGLGQRWLRTRRDS